MDFASYIKRFGTKRLALALNVPPPTVYMWVSRNRVPRERWPDMLVACPDLSVDDLFAMDHLRKERA